MPPATAATARDLGLMQGCPPPDDKVVTVANWQDAPYNRWAFQHVSQVIPSAQISRGAGPVVDLPRAPQDLDDLSFETPDGPTTLAAMLQATYTDGFIVLQDGRIVVEQYFNDMTADRPHLLMSVSKSLTGMLAGILADRGLVEMAAPIGHYIPALQGSAYGDATVQQALDMTVAVVFSEQYDDPTSEVQAQDRAVGWRPARDGDIIGNYHFLPTIKKAGDHGAVFQYCSATTDVLAWVLERVAGAPFADLLGREMWAHLGAEHDGAVTVDRYGAALANGGICVTLRDLARFGQMILADGHAGGRSVVPSRWIEQTRNGGDNGPWSHHERWFRTYPRGNYHNQWYNTEDSHRSFFGTGIHGQHLWIDPAARLVIAKVSTRPAALDERLNAATLQGFAAIGQALR